MNPHHDNPSDMDTNHYQDQLTDAFNPNGFEISYLETEEPVDHSLPWMTHHQPIPPSQLPQAPGPLMFEGFIPQAFPSDFAFSNDDRHYHVPPAPEPVISLQPDLPEDLTPPEQPSGPVPENEAEHDDDEKAVEADDRDQNSVEAETNEQTPTEDSVASRTKASRVGRSRKTHGRKRGRPKGSGKRGGWSKGMKLGPRPTLEASPEFNLLHQQAMDAFIDHQDAEKAQELILQAIKINPEIFSAHALLAETYLSQGEEPKAVTALWTGAHSFPRDMSVWQQCLDTVQHRTTYDRKIAWQQAEYFLRRIVAIEPNDHDKRFHWATALKESGEFGKALTQIRRIFKAMPHNSSCLKLYSQCAQGLGQREWAIDNYKASMAHYMEVGMTEHDKFEWGDVSEYAHLLATRKGDTVENIVTAIKVSKRLSRWLLGRDQEFYWDSIEDDDREWDAEDEPRRVMVDEYEADRFDQETYGVGLPLEIRAQLGMLRLRQGGHRAEALGHFEWLEPEETDESANVHEYPDVFLDVAHALKDAREHQEALRFYEPLLQAEAFEDEKFYVGIGTSSFICGNHIQALECFDAALKKNEQSIEARTYISKIYARQGSKEQAFAFADTAVQIARGLNPRTDRRKYERKDQRHTREAAETALKEANKMPGPKAQRSRKRKQADEDGPEPEVTPRKRRKAPGVAAVDEAEQVRQLYDTLVYNTDAMRNGDTAAKGVWMECAKELTSIFCEVTLFFPADPSIRFTGYHPTHRRRIPDSSRLNSTLASSVASPSSFNPDSPLPSIEPYDIFNERLTPPSDFHSIDFSDWLDIFLEYSLLLSNATSLPSASRKESSYNLIKTLLRCSLYRHSQPFLLQIHTTWLSIALALHDERTLFYTILRFFIKEYTFCTDAYRLFGAMNFLFHTGRPTSGPSMFQNATTQKFLFRHVMGIDHYLPSTYTGPNEGGEGVPEFMRRARADHLPLPSTMIPNPLAGQNDKLTIQPQEMDVVLLTVYGQMTYSAGSYTSALQYFHRARAIDPHNALVLLSISLCYFHGVFKQRSEHRHQDVLQGWAFFSVYEEARIGWARKQDARRGEEDAGDGERGKGEGEMTRVVKREVEFNRARCWMMLGMSDVAVRTLRKLVDEELEVEAVHHSGTGEGKDKEVDWSKEAAYMMANMYASNGDAGTARIITEKYLVVE